jgi:hypothetical protein
MIKPFALERIQGVIAGGGDSGYFRIDFDFTTSAICKMSLAR